MPFSNQHYSNGANRTVSFFWVINETKLPFFFFFFFFWVVSPKTPIENVSTAKKKKLRKGHRRTD
jgi:hypothetical protein